MLKHRNSKTPMLVEWVLLLLAIAVVSWGLQAKLSLYQGNARAVAPMNSSAKLTTGETAAGVKVSLERQSEPSATRAHLDILAAVASLHLDQNRREVFSHVDLHPGAAMALTTSGSNLCRRPPPSTC